MVVQLCTELIVYCVHACPHGIILQNDIAYLSFKTTVNDIEWSDSKRVNERKIHEMRRKI